ncbi:MAG: CopG family ribbon-helix-helix protein [Halorientalis sp.]
MSEYDDTVTVELALPTDLLAAVDEAAAERGHDARSEAAREALAVWIGAVEDGSDEESGLAGLTDRLGDRNVDVDVGVDVFD